jgi:tRNA-splicing ligase RtcB
MDSRAVRARIEDEVMTNPTTSRHEILPVERGVSIKAWVRGVPFDESAKRQLENLARLPIVHGWVAAMPDVHVGIGATVGSVVATRDAIVPAAVGVDIGCGMTAVRTTLTASQLPDDLKPVRSAIERAVPHGRTNDGDRGDRGAWHDVPQSVADAWNALEPGYRRIVAKNPSAAHARRANQLGTLGTGNHFIEVCRDQDERVWIVLHSGSRGVGNRIGTYFIQKARDAMRHEWANLPDKDLSWLAQGSPAFDDYVEAVGWAQEYAKTNRRMMMQAILAALARGEVLPKFTTDAAVIDCHHNYVQREVHGGVEVFVTRKGAVRAGKGELGIIPGSMGARSFIVRGRGNPESFESCSHGAGRKYSRGAAFRTFTLEDHARATAGVECRKDGDVLDETPGAYKDIDAVMQAQSDLVEVVHTLKQVVCVKG